MGKKFIKWLLSFLGKQDFFIIPMEVEEILDEVGLKIEEVEWDDISSEAKRSMVYGSIVKRHPDLEKRFVAMAIELVMQGRR